MQLLSFFVFCVFILLFFFTSFVVPKFIAQRLFKEIFLKNNFNKIILTFDDGPSKYTKDVLDFLKENNIKAIFFINGVNLNDYNDIVMRILKEGHILGNHTFSHKHLILYPFFVIKQEIFTLHKLVYELFNIKLTLFRPPYGQFNFFILYVISMIGYKMLLWDIELKDWDLKFSLDKMQKILSKSLRKDSIILLHDGGGNRDRIIDILSLIKDIANKKGYSFWRQNELL